MNLKSRLSQIYETLYEHYGPQKWWPGDSPFEIMVGAILTQAASWTNVEKAIAKLAAADALSPQAIRSMEEAELATLVYPSGYYNAKAHKLKALAEFLGSRFNDDIAAMAQEDMDTLRQALLEVHGIGEETADAILLYAAGHPSFVVDNYTKRIFHRLGVISERARYSDCRAVFMDSLPSDAATFNEYHALIVRHGKEVCRKQQPLCESCCLKEICPVGQSVKV